MTLGSKSQKLANVQRPEVEDFLYHEARLMDDQQWEEWLDMFTEDIIYWIPCNEYDGDPKRDLSIVYDDHQRMKDRVWRLQSGWQHSQDPPSRTRRQVTNVEIEDSSDNELVISSNLALIELRKGVQRLYAGRTEHHLRRVQDSWKICYKKIELLNNNEAMENFTFIA